MEVKLRFPETPKFSDDPASRFLDYYERYLIAKGQQNTEMIWLCAVSEVTAAPWPWLAISLALRAKRCSTNFHGKRWRRESESGYRRCPQEI
jgi:hypothetical protein